MGGVTQVPPVTDVVIVFPDVNGSVVSAPLFQEEFPVVIVSVPEFVPSVIVTTGATVQEVVTFDDAVMRIN